MILSIARADVDEATQANVFGAWSNLVVGNRPDGLIDSYLLTVNGQVRVVAVWESREHHDSAIHEDRAHPAYVVFEASGLDCTHEVLDVVGSIHQH
jgi:hypothetical protein